MLTLIAEALMETLPHGSGIDCDWTWTRKGESLRFINHFHILNEHGYYVGWQTFSLVIPLHSETWDRDWKVEFHSPRFRGAAAFGLKEYLEDTFAQWMDEIEDAFDPVTFRNWWWDRTRARMRECLKEDKDGA